MIALKDKVQDALDEARTLVLGTQVLLGFQCQSAFQPGFIRLAPPQQGLSLLALLLLIENFALLLLPAAYRLIGSGHQDSPFDYDLTSRCVALALPLFATAIGIDIYLATEPTVGEPAAASLGAAMALAAVGAWYLRRPRPARETRQTKEAEMVHRAVPLKDRIRHVLTETRVVLPGAQALLGFAFITTMLDSFATLPGPAKAIHLASLAAVAVSIILLMTPAAVHRIAEHGEATEAFLRLASLLLVAAMIALGLSLAGEAFLVVYKVTGSDLLGAVLALVVALSFATLWFGVPIMLRRRRG